MLTTSLYAFAERVVHIASATRARFDDLKRRAARNKWMIVVALVIFGFLAWQINDAVETNRAHVQQRLLSR